MQRVVLVLLAAITFLWAEPGFAQSGNDIQSLRRDIEALKQGQSAILKELQELRTLLQARPAQARPVPPTPPPPPQNVVLSLQGAYAKGAADAKVVLIDFTDYQCPFCGRYARETYPRIEADYIKTGKVRYVVREFPLESIHPQAFKASEGALCAGDQGKYFEMHDRLFADQRALAPDDLVKHAEALGLDGPAFRKCVESGKHADRVRRDQQEGLQAGVNATPSFFMAVADPADPAKVTSAARFAGAYPYERFKEVLDALLSK